ncbi:winged helix-turn-helix domain-containing protein [Streptomyces sp. NPDC048290]|uniref:winged helix-turn-helix domain-containing protein n=1 Tax=Streptomyces sp. NPDC048290 TaxID=3155811 RepID=UPI003431F79D
MNGSNDHGPHPHPHPDDQTDAGAAVDAEDVRMTPQEIADALRERIQSGELKAGQRLPTQADLVEEFGVERGTVRQALRALQDDGLLSHVSKGSPPRIAETHAGPGRSRAARVVLISYLAEAFRAPHVRIDAVCFTAETLLWAIGEMCTAVGRGEARPESVRVRCLLPGGEVRLPYPRPSDGDAGRWDAMEDRMKQQIKDQQNVMQFYLTSVMGEYGVDAQVAFRTLPFVPSVKQYVLNGSLVLQGNYQVVSGVYEDLPDVGPFEAVDVKGFDSPLFEFRHDRGGQDAAMVEDTQNCFDALWESS